MKKQVNVPPKMLKVVEGLGWIMVGVLIRLGLRVIVATLATKRAWRAISEQRVAEAKMWAGILSEHKKWEEADEKTWR